MKCTRSYQADLIKIVEENVITLIISLSLSLSLDIFTFEFVIAILADNKTIRDLKGYQCAFPFK